MPASKSGYPQEWLKKATEDFRRVPARLRESDVEDAAFHLQQALEKFLKGFLLARGWPLKKIHDLEALLDDAVTFDSALEPFRPLLQQVSGYYLIERYPGFEQEEAAEEDVAQAYKQAKRLVQRLKRERLPHR